MSPIDGFLAEWEVTNNNENFGGTYRAADLAAIGRAGGWPAEVVVGVSVRELHEPARRARPGSVIQFEPFGVGRPVQSVHATGEDRRDGEYEGEAADDGNR